MRLLGMKKISGCISFEKSLCGQFYTSTIVHAPPSEIDISDSLIGVNIMTTLKMKQKQATDQRSVSNHALIFLRRLTKLNAGLQDFSVFQNIKKMIVEDDNRCRQCLY